MTDLVILVPVLRRPHRVRPLLRSIRRTTPKPYRVLFISDPGDDEEQDAVRDTGGEVLIIAGSYAAKINAGVQATNEPLVFLGADDLQFHRGWLEAATARLTGGVGVVGVNDLIDRRGRDCATHFLMSRAYATRPTIDDWPGPLHAGYTHNFVDRELIDTATRRHAYVYAKDAVVEHLHHMNGKAQHDSTYAKGDASFRQDERLFRERSRLWVG